MLYTGVVRQINFRIEEADWDRFMSVVASERGKVSDVLRALVKGYTGGGVPRAGKAERSRRGSDEVTPRFKTGKGR